MQGESAKFVVISLIVAVLSLSLWLPLLAGLRKPEAERMRWLARCFMYSFVASTSFCGIVAIWLSASFRTADKPNLVEDYRNMLLACGLFGGLSLLNAIMAKWIFTNLSQKQPSSEER